MQCVGWYDKLGKVKETKEMKDKGVRAKSGKAARRRRWHLNRFAGEGVRSHGDIRKKISR